MKYIAWERGDKVRFTVHDYSLNENKDYIPIILDVLVDKNIFYNNIENFYSNLKNDCENLKKKIIEIINNKKPSKHVIANILAE